MSLRELGPWLLQNPGFRQQLDALTVETTFPELGPTFVRDSGVSSAAPNWPYLLLSASVLAASSDGHCQSAALRIAQARLSYGGLNDHREDSAALILDSLANQPAISLAINRGLLDPNFELRLPSSARLEWTRRVFENSIVLGDGSRVQVNRFQKRFWVAIGAHEWVSISAPTSAGKSFVLARWIRELLRRKPNATVVYIVPTRALIGEVEKELGRLFRVSNEGDVNLSTLPLARSVKSGSANVFVFTQERLQLLLTASPLITVDALVVDEAHKVGDRERGVLLQQVIERVSKGSPHASVVFASPMTSNPEMLIADAPSANRTAFTSDDVTVNQNLFWVSQVTGRPKEWQVTLCLPGRMVLLGQVLLSAVPSPDSKRLPFVAHAIGDRAGGNIIYVNRAADAEKTAMQVFGTVGADGDLAGQQDIENLVELARKVVHEEFLLAKVLRRGIAFHYGNLPLLIRVEIERLFSAGIIRYLICTSTLVEGVNMACRNIFLRGPKKGRGNPMSAEDFWNLAGRAGRWGKEFQGNIFCVDATKPGVWAADGPPKVRLRSPIHRTTDAVLSDPAELLSYIAEGAPRERLHDRPELEHVFSYLMASYVREGTLNGTVWASRFAEEQVRLLNEHVAQAAGLIQTPAWVFERNPGVSPFAMDGLLKYFRERQKPVEELVPVDPASDNAPNVYTKIFVRLAKTTNPRLGPGKRSYALALLVTRWMRGYPLARLISDRIRWNVRHDSGVPTAVAIRAVMEDVEQVARFEAPKGLSCYRDILSVHLGEIGRADLLAHIPDLGVLLEFGVGQQTQVSLIGLGLSRTSAIALSEIIAPDDLTENQCCEWLVANLRLWRESVLPALVKREIEESLVLRAPTQSQDG